MVSLNWVAILVISLGAFVIGALWFGPLFGKIWMRIHGAENKSKAEMEEAMKGMWKLFAWEFITLVVMVMTLDFMMQIIVGFSGMHIGFMVWLGFVLPTYVSGILWGNDPKKWMATKIAVSGAYRLVVLLAAGYILSIWR